MNGIQFICTRTVPVYGGVHRSYKKNVYPYTVSIRFVCVSCNGSYTEPFPRARIFITTGYKSYPPEQIIDYFNSVPVLPPVLSQ